MIESLLIIGSLYTGALFFLSYRSRKEIKTSSDFMLGGAKIGLVLGEGFIEENKDNTIFAKFKYEDRDLIDERKVYQISDLTKLSVSNFKSIYEKSE